MENQQTTPEATSTTPQPYEQSGGCDTTVFIKQQQAVNAARAAMRNSYDPRVVSEE